MTLPLKTLLLVLCAAPALACPTPERSAERQHLLVALSAATSQRQGQAAAAAVWAFWTRAPDDAAQALLDRANAQRLSFEYVGAEADLSALIARCPGFPEGWNQRAFVRFLRGDYEGALDDIRETLALEPAHFGALAGRAQIYYRQGRAGLAQIDLRRAVQVHPWMAERALIADQGKDI